VRHRDSSGFNRSRQHLCVDLVVLATMSSYAERLATRSIDHQDFVSPADEHVVNMPGFTTCLDCYQSAALIGAEQWAEQLDIANGRTPDDCAV
jgi:hypothetical protein